MYRASGPVTIGELPSNAAAQGRVTPENHAKGPAPGDGHQLLQRHGDDFVGVGEQAAKRMTARAMPSAVPAAMASCSTSRSTR